LKVEALLIFVHSWWNGMH